MELAFFQDSSVALLENRAMMFFELAGTHVHLGADGTTDLLDSEQLWSRPPAELDEAVPHWLVAGFPIEPADEPGGAELHPNGDELLASGISCAVAKRAA